MKFSTGTALLSLLTVFVFGPGAARAGQIIDGATGLASPAATINFAEISLPANTSLTTQYYSAGVTFAPNMYYDADTTYFTNSVANFTFATQPAYINPVVISFDSPQTSVAMDLVGTSDLFLFQAFLGGTGGTLVDSFSAPIQQTPGFYGFTNETFDTIEITNQAAPFSPPYWEASNLELSNATIPGSNPGGNPGGNPPIGNGAFTGVPEPSSFLLLGPALAGLWLASRGVLSRRRIQASEALTDNRR